MIVGAGPSGMLTALGLAREGVPVIVLEAEDRIIPSPRAIVYHWTVLEGLDRLGILDEAQRRGFCKQDYQFRAFDSGERIEWSLDVLADETPYPYNVHLGQHELAEIALEHLMRLPDTEVVWSARVEGLSQDSSGVTVTASGPDGRFEFRGAWCIGADGARSTVRRLIGQPFGGMTWPERFVATNVRYDFQGRGFARTTMLADPRYGAIIAKIDTTDLWRCTYAEDAALPEDRVRERIPAYFAAVLGEQPELDRYQPYSMHQRAAEEFRVGRVLLCGDAAHVTNPTGGLGLTSALFDSFALVPALRAVIEGAAVRRLDEWARTRRRIFLEIASPQASENKRMLYSERDPERRREDFERMRRATDDIEALRERLRFTLALRS